MNSTAISSRALFLSLFILFFGLLAALGIVNKSNAGEHYLLKQPSVRDSLAVNALVSITPVAANDYRLGPSNAPVKIIEYADLECSASKEFHAILHRAVEEYNGQLAWVYRHRPLAPSSITEAIAAECAGELGGGSVFWGYVDMIFSVTASDYALPKEKLLETAEYFNINREQFSICLENKRYDDKVKAMLADSSDAGATYSPYSVIFSNGGFAMPIKGSINYDSLKVLVDMTLEGSADDNLFADVDAVRFLEKYSERWSLAL